MKSSVPIKQLALALATFFLMGAYADPCGGQIGDPCDVDAECRGELLCLGGSCQEPGTCICTEEYNPVCGVDGETYGNACMARCADVDIDHEGPCEPVCEPVLCDLYCPHGFVVDEDGCEICECVEPDPCRSNADCEPDDVCIDGECGPPCEVLCVRYDPVCGTDGVTYGCGAPDAACHGVGVAYEGECEDECICTDEWAPVCGVDGETYGNACEARCAGVAVAYPGECGCMCTADYRPVCGVDGETYGNACRAGCAGVEIAYEGECRDECRSNEDCRDGLICYPPTQLCQPVCEIYCFRYDPVCGEDGVTYACGEQDAFCHGTKVEHEGECREECPEILCDLWCPNGFQLGEDGCPICVCVPECEPVMCEMACPWGFAIGPDGCEICECAEPPVACLSNDDCREGQRCDTENYCLSPPDCDPGDYCPTVCYGACVDR